MPPFECFILNWFAFHFPNSYFNHFAFWLWGLFYLGFWLSSQTRNVCLLLWAQLWFPSKWSLTPLFFCDGPCLWIRTQSWPCLLWSWTLLPSAEALVANDLNGLTLWAVETWHYDSLFPLPTNFPAFYTNAVHHGRLSSSPNNSIKIPSLYYISPGWSFSFWTLMIPTCITSGSRL